MKLEQNNLSLEQYSNEMVSQSNNRKRRKEQSNGLNN